MNLEAIKAEITKLEKAIKKLFFEIKELQVCRETSYDEKVLKMAFDDILDKEYEMQCIINKVYIEKTKIWLQEEGGE